MRIGLTGGGATVDQVVAQAQQAEADGFSALWYASLVTGDPLVAIALAGRETSAGQVADGTILWMAPVKAVEAHVVPKITAAAAAAGRPAPRIVAGPPVAVHDELGEARSAAAESSQVYAGMANYQRILDLGDAASPADAAIVGNEKSVTRQLQALIDAGATDIWAAVFPVGADREDRTASIRRTTDLLRDLVT